MKTLIFTTNPSRVRLSYSTLLTLLFSTFILTSYANGSPKPYVTTKNGLHFQTQQGLLRVEFVTPTIVRVQYTKEADFWGNGTIVCLERSGKKVSYQLKETPHEITLQSDSLSVAVDMTSHAITYRDAQTNRILLAEKRNNPREGEAVYRENITYNEQTKRIEKSADGEKEVVDVLSRDTIGESWRYRNHFEWADNEAIYGLGSHMEDYLNLRGKELYLCQHNLKAMVPVLNSTAGYGLLFDAGCGMIYSDKADDNFIQLESANQIDYYFMKGATMDKVIAQYRLLTGECPMLPRYMFGYIQSKERYASSKELIQIVTEYRKRQVPLDVIVQDWSYWPQGWGYLKMDPKYYPNPANLADSIHALHAKLMISIWPNPTSCPQTDDFAQRGFMLNHSIYDAYNPKARQLYWQYANNEFFSKGFDAWWCDCTEPLDADWKIMPEGYGVENHKERWEKNLALLSDVLGPERSNTFSLYHSKGIYENQRLTSDKKRVVNLTRSSYAGQQRYSTISWNGDTYASWQSFAQQIPSGLNFMATGCPYWTIDIGAFFTRKREQWFWAGEFDKGVHDLGYREFYTRMFQYATFLPIFRSHGTDTPREIWRFGEPGEPFYESLLKMIHLRYSLLPYIYSIAGKVTHEDYTMTRMLAFDFPHDPNVFNIKDQFMFGPSLLVSPITTPMYYQKEGEPLEGVEKSRTLYLPKGANWIDYWSGKTFIGGEHIQADAPIDKIPLFVRQGSIIPMSPAIQHTGEVTEKELEIAIYPGGEAHFTLYEDEGDNYNYEQGASSTIEMSWNETKQTLTLGKRNGAFEGIAQVRTLHLVLHKNGKPTRKTVHYRGEPMKCKF